ncbi:MAG: AbrB/MazE/SpoVT family DNA-binding domain-containing protein [Clostridiales bacterium]|nr:AbrB/MazE/SpoVT family DNA-binding domain-containing protein [Clostridiales bacterium]
MAEKFSSYMGTVKVGAKGQIVIPKEIREMFDITPGDSLIIMAHPQKGIGIERQSTLLKLSEAIFSGRGREIIELGNDDDNLNEFARKVTETIKGGEENDGD